ncbi:hypothetical protein [Paenibacillus durus]|uniref:hypothetical protein n=1 Tax=Paenibacillus durus TaxID=44251 RepID=UPI000AF5F489|nr:hypothetical protein [Paenibacillus durus]
MSVKGGTRFLLGWGIAPFVVVQGDVGGCRGRQIRLFSLLMAEQAVFPAKPAGFSDEFRGGRRKGCKSAAFQCIRAGTGR